MYFQRFISSGLLINEESTAMLASTSNLGVGK
jgi:hypothetical protein